MNYKLILLLLVSLFIGANLMCGCCRYPVFDYLMGRRGNIKEGIDNKDVGPPGSTNSVKKAASDTSEVISSQQKVPDLVAATASKAALSTDSTKNGMTGMNGIFMSGLNAIGVGGPAARDETIPINNSREGMAVMGSDVNEVQNGDVAGMWVSKANTYASEFGYGVMNNTGSAYTADEPLKNGEMVIFAKNKSKPECCPSPYSTSTGCVCITPEQINYLNTRGGNRTSDSGV
jgi:hypothetical protein